MPGLRSSLRATPRKKYTNDPFEAHRDLLSGGSSQDEDAEGGAEDDDESDEADYRAEPEPDDDDDVMSQAEDMGVLEDADPGASDVGEQDLDDDMSIAEDSGSQNDGPVWTKQARKRKVRVENLEGTAVYNRGMPEFIHNRVTQTEREIYFYGPTIDDYGALLNAYERWCDQPTVPKRTVNLHGRGGFAYSSAFEQELKKTYSNWRWYSEDGGRENFQQQQISRQITADEAKDYLLTDHLKDRAFVIGPTDQKKLIKLRPRQFLALSEPFRQARSPLPPNYKPGFLINMGARIGCLAWVPNQLGAHQYLTVAVLPTRHNRGDDDASAMTPQHAVDSSIQIWKFTASQTNSIDKAVAPQLSRVLCTSIGDIRVLHWCPVPSEASGSLGLLACISSDGVARVYDVAQPTSDPDTTYTLLEEAAFETRPPNTVCTTLTWISSTRLAVGCANGCIAIYDIDKHIRDPNGSQRPILYTSLCTTYIFAMSSGYPSLPHLLMTYAVDGQMRMTDLSQPLPTSPSATAVSQRARIAQPGFTWLDVARAIVSPEDNGTVRAFTVRRWFTSIGVGRVNSQGICIATSPCHASTLLGTTEGEAVVSNPLVRMLKGAKHGIFQQNWFTHDWRRPSEEERLAAESYQEGAPSDAKVIAGRDGLSRILDGYKAYSVTLNSNGQVQRLQKDVSYLTIHEEKSAITAVAWNPNLHVAGWAAAGMADGLLRVEDIAI